MIAFKRYLKNIIKRILRMIWGKNFLQISKCLLTTPCMNGKVVSFDVFDTLLYRTVADPTDVFGRMEEKLGIEHFKEYRIVAEKVARKKNMDQGIEEVTLEEIYGVYADLYADGKDDGREKELFIEKLLLSEMDYEIEFCYPNENALKLFNELKAIHNKGDNKIIIVSDMYLGKDVIEKMLSINGFEGFEKVFVSSEYGVTKKKGDLFDVVLHEYAVKPDDILHIGDNFISDYLRPRQRGMRSILCKR